MSHIIDLTGQIFGRLTVLQKAENNKDNYAWWLCQCNCGNQCVVKGFSLRKGTTKSCGCLRKEKTSNNLIGQHFGKLYVLEKTNKRIHRHIVWKCQCECGNICEVASNALKSGHTQSCGCNHESLGELEIKNLLEKNNIQYIREYTQSNWIFSDTGYNGRFDFYLPEYNRLIEFDGEQHYNNQVADYFRINSLQIIQNHDIIKNKWAQEANIPLVRIPYWLRNNITLDMLLKNDYLLNYL